ncbi:type I restriction enzyme, S subunit [Vibrio crassostreae]|nr:type I restriction enzyme, S subunit [Vibrio crassostreae]CAK3585927.1 type I restriction enzyme, S subunit [Vibrio crassostreae]
MSVDTEREFFHVNVVKSHEIQDFLSAQTYRPAITKAYNVLNNLKNIPLQKLCSVDIRQGATPHFSDSGFQCIKSKQTREVLLLDEGYELVDPNHVKNKSIVKLEYGDIVVTRQGSGTIGRASIFLSKDQTYITDSLFRVSSNCDECDAGYLVTFLRTYTGQRLIEKGVYGSTGQLNLSSSHIKQLPVFNINLAAQKYIGEKVRQADRLRTLVKLLDCELKGLVLNDVLEEANKTAIQSFNRVDVEDMFPRLDPKYYGNRSLSVHHAAASSSYSLDSLKKSINNGFEERDFVDSGIDYITVSEVSSGRIELSTAPKISELTDIPDKAYVNERCVLVVRTGSIGTAVKVDIRDKNAVISSHLIKLEFDSEELAAAVAAFLNSASGKVLQRKISYGAVQPQIGQDELLALPIPRFVLDNADSILALTQAKENATRCSRWLTQSAKLFVEDLIEGQLTESQLVSAQQALEEGDDSLDRALLERMTAKGIDGEGDPLFDDIDQLYDLLEQAEQALDAEDTMAEA